MSIGFKILALVSFGMMLIVSMSDILTFNKMLEDNFSTVRTANEHALELIKGKEEITEIEMLNNWLYCFAEDNNMIFDELKISFISLGTDPAYYVVRIEGSNDYALISDDVHTVFTNAMAIVESEKEKN